MSHTSHGQHGRRRRDVDDPIDTTFGPFEIWVGHRSSCTAGWEEFGRSHPSRTVPNRPELLPTELKWSV